MSNQQLICTCLFFLTPSNFLSTLPRGDKRSIRHVVNGSCKGSFLHADKRISRVNTVSAIRQGSTFLLNSLYQGRPNHPALRRRIAVTHLTLGDKRFCSTIVWITSLERCIRYLSPGPTFHEIEEHRSSGAVFAIWIAAPGDPSTGSEQAGAALLYR